MKTFLLTLILMSSFSYADEYCNSSNECITLSNDVANLIRDYQTDSQSQLTEKAAGLKKEQVRLLTEKILYRSGEAGGGF